MGVIHSLEAFAEGGLRGIQEAQRDWSPYVAHFTSYQAMQPVRDAISDGASPDELTERLQEADEESFQNVESIAESQSLLAHHPPDKPNLPEIVSLSECTLPGLIGLSERYGRFGFVFNKDNIYSNGGRPCAYMSEEYYGLIAELRSDNAGVNVDARASLDELFAITNLYRPPGEGQVQDYTHEREWRHFADLEFAIVEPLLFLCPESYVDEMFDLFGNDNQVLPLEVLHRWGV